MMRLILLLNLLMFLIFSCKNEEKAPEVRLKSQDWWKESIVYQIYPRSFKDTDGDGIGDLKGIIQELDYIQSLGVNAVWLNPIYSSPNKDNGYDVSDYRAIMADFGTMADFDLMLEGMHARGIDLIMDIVVNHSSDQHEWFKQSRSSRDNPYRDYYHWWPAEKGEPNYRYSLFDATGNAWKYDSLTNAYYLHYFADSQPDLNWENPKVRQEVYDIMNFWAEKGVDGFRLDAFQYAAKDRTFPKFPDGFEKNFVEYYAMQGNLHGYLKEMNAAVLSKYPVMTVAEGAGRNLKEAHELVDADRKELNMAYAFDGVDIPKYEGYELSTFKDVFSRWDSAFAEKGWLSIFLSNHDQARMVNRYGNPSDTHRAASTKLLNTFILTMRGTPYCYYGDELGMTNIDFQHIDQYQDIAAINGYKKAASKGEDMALFLKKLNFSSRDNGRTPMQWSAEPQAGFTTGTPWLPVNSNHSTLNVEVQEANSSSILNHFKSLTALRKAHPALVHGAYSIIQKEHPTVYAYSRVLNSDKYLVLLNFSDAESTIALEAMNLSNILVNNFDALNQNDSKVLLKPWQAVVIQL